MYIINFISRYIFKCLILNFNIFKDLNSQKLPTLTNLAKFHCTEFLFNYDFILNTYTNPLIKDFPLYIFLIYQGDYIPGTYCNKVLSKGLKKTGWVAKAILVYGFLAVQVNSKFVRLTSCPYFLIKILCRL